MSTMGVVCPNQPCPGQLSTVFLEGLLASALMPRVPPPPRRRSSTCSMTLWLRWTPTWPTT